MNRTFHIPARLHPGYSLLGRWLRTRARTPWQAESRLIVMLALGSTAIAVAAQVAWSLGWVSLSEASVLALGGLILLTGIGLAGWQPAVTIRCTPDRLHLQRGAEQLAIPHDAILDAKELPALRYHRHARRRPDAHQFVNRIPKTVLHLDTTQGPVLIGLGEEDRMALMELLRRQRGHLSPFESHVG